MRQEYSLLRRQLSAAERKERDSLICRAITGSASFRYAKTLLAYAPKDVEVDILPAVRSALDAGKRVSFPRCFPDNTIRFFFAAPEELSAGAFGIQEPTEGALPCTDFENAICLVPGLLFDKEGYRIGYGKGYYDRFLSHFNGVSLGIVRQDFILPTVPHGRFDTRVTALVSEKGVQIIE